MKNIPIKGYGIASGKGRTLKAVTQALNSLLFYKNNILDAKYVLVSIICGTGKDELTMDELSEITDRIQKEVGKASEIIQEYSTEEIFENKVSVTIISGEFIKDVLDLREIGLNIKTTGVVFSSPPI